uniref:Uncharacterized protein n=1 Tax=Oryza nivara TaxID=4536 RepID=A0A0E0H928_ORYNI
MPFGLSARTYLGQNLALVEVKTLVAAVLARFEFTLSPEFGLRLRIRRAAKSKGKKNERTLKIECRFTIKSKGKKERKNTENKQSPR